MVEVKLGHSKYAALVDDPDWELVRGWCWNAQVQRYKGKVVRVSAQRSCIRKGKQSVMLMHRWILGIDGVKGVQVDHINGNGLDNRRSNLRIASQSENLRNRKMASHNRSGFKGVYFAKQAWAVSKPWRAQIKVNGRKLSLGYFLTPEEAYEAYKEAAIQHHGQFANFGERPS